MSRDLRIQFPGAIYHVTSRGNRRQDIVLDDLDRDTFFERIGITVEKYGWQMFASALMTNHFHLFFRTPQPNLSRGMQFLLGGYASWWNWRHERSGHVFQGRFRGHLVENEIYFWAVSRYVHLNPVPILVNLPQEWRWSSYAGYLDPSRRLPWIDYQALLDAWQGDFGGCDPSLAYRQFVEGNDMRRSPSPFENAVDGWILGSDQFVERIRGLISPSNRQPTAKASRRRSTLSPAELQRVVCEVLEVDTSILSVRGNRHPARALFAYLAHSHTDATLSQVAQQLGLARPDSVPTQIRRVTESLPGSEIRLQAATVESRLGLRTNSAAL